VSASVEPFERVRGARKRPRSTVALAVIVAVVLLLLGLAWALETAAADLRAQNAILRGDNSLARTPWSMLLAHQLAGDLPPDELDPHTGELSNHADRLQELAGVIAVGGLLLALLTGDRAAAEPDVELERDRESSPLASTSNNGTV
jgi:hypothetical protein